MKVLFAVNDENISTSIVKKYQKQYKEIISYKNVYYFNAILKELQRNKNYDRVVISEDLEEFTSTSYEQKDKFIFDRLDNISDEAVSDDGTDIPIVLICSERRTKSEDILVKLFGISIYNAIIGEDISIDEVCRLINKPRSKKEAKLYYKIDTENVTYEKEDDDNVSEMEMQNILMHFKKLGKNEEEYAESFRNIVSQYNEKQLKIIVSILPNNVKDILEETSTEYQKIIRSMGKQTTGKEKSSSRKSTTQKSKKGTSEQLLDIGKGTSKPVVMPTSIDKSMYKKVSPKKKIEIDLEDDDDEIIDDVEEIIMEKPKRRGRPKKTVELEKQEEPKKIEIKKKKTKKAEEIEEEPIVKRRGRPKKKEIEEEYDEEESAILPGFEEDEEESSILPGFEDEEELEEEEYTKPAKKDSALEDLLNDFSDNNEEEYEEDDDEDDDYQEESNQYDEDDEDEYDNEDIKQHKEDEYFSKDLLQKANVRLRKNDYYQPQEQEEPKYDNIFNEGEFERLLTNNQKVATFVGTSKNGTSFIVNNLAIILSSMGINTAILDATKNKNAYYIYTKNDEDLRRTAVNSIDDLINGVAEGIKVNNNLTVYTTIPSQNDKIKNSRPILETLVKNHSLILIDCDFDTSIEYFDKSQEIYLIQSMDVLTIQPLTEFLRELKMKNVLEESKIRIILNKILRVKGVNGNNIVGGMSNYNDPEMSFMTELFNRNTVKIAGQLPFDEDVYAKYLENMVECEMKLNSYPKEFKARLNTLADAIYSVSSNKVDKRGKKEIRQQQSSFSSGMNSTLDNMRKKY